MQKIVSLFQRNYETDRLVRDEAVPGAEWVLAGEGVATQKLDGTCCMVRSGKLYKRYDLKPGKAAPSGFEPAQEPDPVTGRVPGWVPVGDGPDDAWHREAWLNRTERPADGTYELLGPKIQGNPEGVERHELVLHGAFLLVDCPRSWVGLRDYFRGVDGTSEGTHIEGVVWHHPDGRMVKIKAKDFGIKRK